MQEAVKAASDWVVGVANAPGNAMGKLKKVILALIVMQALSLIGIVALIILLFVRS